MVQEITTKQIVLLRKKPGARCLWVRKAWLILHQWVSDKTPCQRCKTQEWLAQVCNQNQSWVVLAATRQDLGGTHVLKTIKTKMSQRCDSLFTRLLLWKRSISPGLRKVSSEGNTVEITASSTKSSIAQQNPLMSCSRQTWSWNL